MKNLLRSTTLACAALCLGVGLASASPAFAKTNSSDLVRTAQERLTNLGYYTGREDGVMGKVTENALMDFQRRNSLLVSGRLTPETYDLLTQAHRVGYGTAMYPYYEVYNHAATYDPSVFDGAVVWQNRWHYADNQDLPLRFGRLTVHQEGNATLRHYTIVLNGRAVLYANDQPAILRVSETFALPHADAIIFTAYHVGATCPNKSYLLVVHGDGSFTAPHEIGNCAGSYEARVEGNSLLVSFPGMSVLNNWQTWDTWKYENEAIVRY